MSNVIICGPRNVETIHTEDWGVRWCFYCRKRVPFTYSVKQGTDPDGRPDYWGPWPEVKCPSGHSNGDCFPGYEREWDW